MSSDLIGVMRAIEPDLLVHALFSSETLCRSGMSHQFGKNEVWVNLDQSDLLTCPACIEALSRKRAEEAKARVREEIFHFDDLKKKLEQLEALKRKLGLH